MEIPTGFLADFWGHRICMRAGAAVLTAANLLPVLAPTYDGFLAHFLLIALARSLISGASSAYLYDFLKAQGQVSLYKEAEGKARAYGLVGKVVLWAGIGSAMQWRLELPYWLTALFSAVSIGYAFALPAVAVQTDGASKGARTQVWKQLGPVLSILGRSPALVLIMLQGIALFVLGRIVGVNLFQPVLAAKHFGLGAYGMVMSAMTVFEALGSAYPRALKRWWSDLNAVFVLTVVLGISVGAMAWGGAGFAGQASVVFWLCLFSLAFGLAFPIQRQLLNDAIPDSRYRATLLSIESLMDRAVCAWVAAILADMMGAGKMNSFLLASAGMSLGGAAILFRVMRSRASSAPADSIAG
jgi:hypothetical protein